MITTTQLNAAQAWADEALKILRTMTLDERYFWLATKPRGQMHFNKTRVRYVIETFPALRALFAEFGVLP